MCSHVSSTKSLFVTYMLSHSTCQNSDIWHTKPKSLMWKNTLLFFRAVFFFPSFLYCLLIWILNTKSCGYLHSLSVNNTLHPVQIQTLPLIGVSKRGLDLICCCSFSYGTLSMPMLISGSSSLESSSLLSFFLFFALFLLTFFCLGFVSLKVLGTQCFAFLFGTKKVLLCAIIL